VAEKLSSVYGVLGLRRLFVVAVIGFGGDGFAARGGNALRALCFADGLPELDAFDFLRGRFVEFLAADFEFVGVGEELSALGVAREQGLKNLDLVVSEVDGFGGLSNVGRRADVLAYSNVKLLTFGVFEGAVLEAGPEFFVGVGVRQLVSGYADGVVEFLEVFLIDG